MEHLNDEFDIIVIGAGSGGLSVGLFMNQAGFRVLMVSRSDAEIGGDCLNDGCVPSKAMIHVSKIVRRAAEARRFGLEVSGSVDMQRVVAYIRSRQSEIRSHENASWLRDQGITVALGEASFVGKRGIVVSGKAYTGRKIVIATGSRPRRMEVEGVAQVRYFDNESIFDLDILPERMLCIGAGPIGIEMAQTLSRLGSKVTVIDKGSAILEHDDRAVTEILKERMEEEGIRFLLGSEVERFSSAHTAIVNTSNGKQEQLEFDAVFVAVGRELSLEPLALDRAGIEVAGNKIQVDRYLRSSNKDVLLCGDIAGDLQFSHAAEFHARIIINNLLSPFKKRLSNDYMSWVTFTDPELATFGLSEAQLKDRGISYRRLEKDFSEDDRAVVDEYQYGKLVLFVSKSRFLGKQRLLGGTMIAPNAGEMVQELIMANTNKLTVGAIFDKVYPYPVAARVNQSLITDLKSEQLTPFIKSLLKKAFRIFS